MRVTYYGYNAFILDDGDRKLAVDPGANLFLLTMKSLIPASEWSTVTHVLVTHADPDHYWYADRVANRSGAPVICNRAMIRERNSTAVLIAPRRGGLTFTTEVERVLPIAPSETIDSDGVRVTGIRTTHGPLKLRVGPFRKTFSPGRDSRTGWGSIGFEIRTGPRVIVVLGDTLLEKASWQEIRNPDLLIVPIGGSRIPNTMNEDEALEAVNNMRPVVVIPCHYDCPGFFTTNANPADVMTFKTKCERTGSICMVMRRNESIEI